MKKQKIFFFLLLILLTSCSSKDHLIFNNTRINGNLKIFVNELTKLGFIVSDSTKRNEIILNGKFLNKDCKIDAFGTEKSNIAFKVIVDMPEESPDSLGTSFGKLQKLFTIIFGPGTSRYQKYRLRESLLFNVPRLKREIRKGDYTRFITELGEVIIEVQDGYISITYVDKLNDDIRKNELEY
ncbi:MAG: hypothetical protein WCP85_23870 [Mariniphaga sp.]